MPIKGDFISFSYNGVHSTELGVMRVTSSNRYTDALLPTIQDKTVQASGSDGTYFFGSYYTQRPITINVAFDEVSESQIRLMRKTFGDGLSHELIFDDEPYKVYYAKATGIPQLQYIPFSTPRVYKGEGTFTFICYDPFAHCKNSQKYLSEFPDATTNVGMNGNIIGFNNGVGNFKKVEVEIEPIQDLHGYANPWAGGAGTNLCRVARTFTTTSQNITYSENEFGTVHCVGTATAESVSAGAPNTEYADERCLYTLPAGTYTISNVGTIRVYVSFRNAENTDNLLSSRNVQAGGSNTFTVSDPVIVYIRADILTGETVDADVLCMVTAGSTMATVFEPYQNICPIIGRTSAKICRFGKNLFNKNGVSSAAVTITQNSSGFRIVSNANGTYKSCYGGFQFQTLDLPDGTEVTFSAHCKVNAGKARIGIRRESNNNLVAYSDLVSSGEADLSLTYTYDKSTPVYLSAFCTWSTSEAGDVEYTNVQLEIGSTVTSYEPYAGDTYSVDWTSVAGTIYKGSFDSVLGPLTKTQRSFDFQGVTPTSVSVLGEMTRFWLYDGNALANGNMLCNMAPVVDNTYYASDEIGVTYFSAYPNSIAAKLPKSLVGTTVDSIRSFLQTGAFQMVQDLVTPVTYQLAPQEISILSGQNYIWSNLETNIDIVYKRLTGITELFKLEWNPSAQLLESKGIYDSYSSSTGFKLYNPGDLEANFKFKVPISASIGGIKIDDGNNHDLESHILMLNGNTITPKGNDVYLLFNSRTNLIEGLNADGARTMNLYNEYISSGHWFKIPMNESNKTWYFVPINYSGDTPVLEYDYLYF